MDIQKSIEHFKYNLKKYCLHPNASKTECDSNIIKSHTIQRRGGLTKIARDGHVYQYDIDITKMIKGSRDVMMKLVGINSASTFTGFCSKHDTETFALIDNNEFGSTEEECMLYVF